MTLLYFGTRFKDYLDDGTLWKEGELRRRHDDFVMFFDFVMFAVFFAYSIKLREDIYRKYLVNTSGIHVYRLKRRIKAILWNDIKKIVKKDFPETQEKTLLFFFDETKKYKLCVGCLKEYKKLLEMIHHFARENEINFEGKFNSEEL